MKIIAENNIKEKMISLDSKLTLNSGSVFDCHDERRELEELLKAAEILKIKYNGCYITDEDIYCYEYKIKYVEGK